MARAEQQAALFEPEHTLGVGELVTRVTRAVAAAFPAEVWVRGEVHGLKAPNANGHVYFELSERNMIDELALRLVHGELPVGS